MAEFKKLWSHAWRSVAKRDAYSGKTFQAWAYGALPVEAGEAIVDMLGSRIPMQDIKLDFFDKLIRQLHL